MKTDTDLNLAALASALETYRASLGRIDDTTRLQGELQTEIDTRLSTLDLRDPKASAALADPQLRLSLIPRRLAILESESAGALAALEGAVKEGAGKVKTAFAELVRGRTELAKRALAKSFSAPAVLAARALESDGVRIAQGKASAFDRFINLHGPEEVAEECQRAAATLAKELREVGKQLAGE